MTTKTVLKKFNVGLIEVFTFFFYDYKSIPSLMSLGMIRRVLFDRHLFVLVHDSSATLIVCEVSKLSLKLSFVVRDSSAGGKFCDDHEQ